MAKFLSQGGIKKEVHYERSFLWRNNPQAGFTFPCDAQGRMLEDRMTEPAKENYRRCVGGEYDVIDEGVVQWTNRWHEPPVIECEDCHRAVVLDYDHGEGVVCGCGTRYNLSGQRLAPREQWDGNVDPEDL